MSTDPLAYLTAKTHGLAEEAQSILEACGLAEDEISLPSLGEASKIPNVVVPTYKANWPVKPAAHSSFEKALLSEVTGEEAIENGYDMVEEEEGGITRGDELGGVEEEDATGWDMDDDIQIEEEANLIDVEAPTGPASSEADLWARNSPLAADHVAAGSFDTAMQLLNRQVGAVNFEPLKPRFMEVYQSSKTYLPATAGLEPLVNYVRRTVEETDSRKVLPIIPRSLETIASVDLQEGYAAMRANKLEDGVQIFRRILNSVLVNTVSSEAHVAEAKKIISTAREYILAMTIELERRSLSTDTPENLKRSLELSAYFTIPKLEVAHRQIALMAAMKLAFTNKNYASALSFANRLLANGGSPKLLEQVSFIFFLNLNKTRMVTDVTKYRPVKSRLSVNATHRTRSRLNSILLPSSTFALPLILPSTVAPLASPARSLEPSTRNSTRAPCAGFARCPRLELPPVACVFSFLVCIRLLLLYRYHFCVLLCRRRKLRIVLRNFDPFIIDCFTFLNYIIITRVFLLMCDYLISFCKQLN